MDNLLFLFTVIGISFILNLIVTLAMRLADKKDRSLKNVNTQIKRFKTDVSTTVARINASAKDCEVNIQSRVDQANAANSKLAESLDMLMVHQKELTDLEYICKSYKDALEKLKSQTEQAEARIFAVQAEVRKAESINTFALDFQADAERLTNQMQDMKAEYIKLIATTEQSLRSAGQAQLAENDKSLASFGEAIDRARGELNEFANNERISIQEMFNNQELATQDSLNQIDLQGKRVQDSLNESITNLDSYRKELEETTDRLNQKREELVTLSQQLIENYKGDLESTGEAVANTLEARIRDKEEELNSSFETCTEKFQQKENEIDKALEEIYSKKAIVLSALDLAVESRKKDIESATASLENEKNLYVNKSKEALDKAFSESLASAKDAVATLRGQGEDMIVHLDQRISDARETYTLVASEADEKLSTAITSLASLEEKLKLSRNTFNSLGEAITNKRQEIYNMNKTEKEVQEELDKIYQDVEKAKEAAQSAKEARITEEAKVVRLKFQQSELLKQKEEQVEAKQEEPSKEENDSTNKFEGMIEEFPDDIEYIDLDEDEE